MSEFKEKKKKAIDAGKEKGDAGIAQGEKRLEQLKSVKNLFDGLNLEDEADKQQAEMLKEQYKKASLEAHKREVADVVKSAKDDLERNKNDIKAERKNVETAIGKVRDMKGVTDLARNEADKVGGSLERSANEHKDMEVLTTTIEDKQESASKNVLEKIKNVFG